MNDVNRRLLRLALTLAEAKGKFSGSTYSSSERTMRDLILSVGAEIESIVTGAPVAADTDDFDSYKVAS